jgi:pyruvate kinase
MSNTRQISPSATKIVATLGPASDSVDVLRKLIPAGLRVARLNFSHGTREEHARTLEAVRQVEAELGIPVAILGDLCGPKIRLGEVTAERVHVEPGQEVVLDPEATGDDPYRLSLNQPEILDDLEVGQRVLINDGDVRLRTVERRDRTWLCRCEVGGSYSSRKGVNLPDTQLRLSTLTDKDYEDAAWAVEVGVDYLALSFVRSADDIRRLASFLRERRASTESESGGGAATAAGSSRAVEVENSPPIIAKIETPAAVANLGAILAAADGLMIARGDLGVELDVATVPRLQKEMIDLCRSAGKPAIVATQMLQSMVEHSVPTRAEVSDVANAVYDGTDAVMLSAETAVGKHPVRAVEMLARVCKETEEHDQERQYTSWFDTESELAGRHAVVPAAIARSVASAADDVDAAAVVVWTATGTLARLISKHRLDRPVLAIATTPATRRQLTMYYGVTPLSLGIAGGSAEGSAAGAGSSDADADASGRTGEASAAVASSGSGQPLDQVDDALRDGGWAHSSDTIIIATGPGCHLATAPACPTASMMIHVVG